MKYWREKYWTGEKLLRKLTTEHNKEIKKLQGQFCDLTLRANAEFESMILHLQNHIKRNKNDLCELQQNGLTDNGHQSSEHKDPSDSRLRQKRISVGSTTSYLPYSSTESLNTRKSSSFLSLPDHVTPTDLDNNETLAQSVDTTANNNMMSTNTADYLVPFTKVMSDNESERMQAVNGQPDVHVHEGSEINSYHNHDDDDDDDDRSSVTTVISSSGVEPEASSQGDGSETHRNEPQEEYTSHSDTTDSQSEELLSHGADLHVDSHRNEIDSQHSDEQCSQGEESDLYSDEPAELREYREIHSRITRKYKK